MKRELIELWDESTDLDEMELIEIKIAEYDILGTLTDDECT